MKMLILFVAVFFVGCSTSHIVKECKPVVEGEHWVCKNLKPWE